MSDGPGGGHPPDSFPKAPPILGRPSPVRTTPGQPENLDPFRSQYGLSVEGSAQGTQIPFHSQIQPPFYHPQQYRQPQQPFAHQTLSNVQDPGRGTPLNLSSMAGALPEVGYGQGYVPQSSGRSPSGSSPGQSPYQFQQVAQFQGLTTPNQPAATPYSMQFPQQYQGMYPTNQQMPPQPVQSGQASAHQYYQAQSFMTTPQTQQMQPYFYQQGQYSSPGQPYPGSPYQLPFGNRATTTSEVGLPGPQMSSEQLLGSPRHGLVAPPGNTASNPAQSSTPRGPPRKPKQSGHALWVGNLPPGANIVDLKDHFSRDATENILSVFLISKSNCAFVNYKTEASCAAAMARFHDFRFQGVRLVCRLRRSPANAGPGVPTGPAALSSPQTSTSTVLAAASEDQPQQGDVDNKEIVSEEIQVKEKFFIVKSLTVEDLELSVRNGVWATQSHNEDALNKAFEAVENVYLIFSANKSGEYFGYARMVSAINEDPAAAIEFAPNAQTAEDPDLPKAIPTEATEFAPRGRIIDDSARGTIFWEAEVDDPEGLGEPEDTRSDTSEQEGDQTATKAWGKPFKVEWLSTSRLPFYRTRGLRNPWNSNREVKIARDGTELETSVGRRLIQMFHRDSPTVPNLQAQMPQPMGGYPHMRPY